MDPEDLCDDMEEGGSDTACADEDDRRNSHLELGSDGAWEDEEDERYVFSWISF